jgi:hypothetical protein
MSTSNDDAMGAAFLVGLGLGIAGVLLPALIINRHDVSDSVHVQEGRAHWETDTYGKTDLVWHIFNEEAK